MNRYTYSFNEYEKSNHGDLGKKAVDICNLSSIGIPIPFGFVISKKAFSDFKELRKDFDFFDDEIFDLMIELRREVKRKVHDIEEVTGLKSDDINKPLILSLRVAENNFRKYAINGIGLSCDTEEAFKNRLGDDERAEYYNSELREGIKNLIGNSELLTKYTSQNHKIRTPFAHDEIEEVPATIIDQLMLTIFLIFETEFIKSYSQEFNRGILGENVFDFGRDNEMNRDTLALPSDIFLKKNDEEGISIIIQNMVFPDLKYRSGKGVVFTRDPVSGENELRGAVLSRSLEEDAESFFDVEKKSLSKLKHISERTYEKIHGIGEALERHYKQIKAFEFVIEQGNLFVLREWTPETRPQADIKIAVDMVEEGIIAKSDAILRIDLNNIDEILHLSGDQKRKNKELIEYYNTVMAWVDGIRDMRVRANADTPEQVMTATKFGADGIGLCRTEGMFRDRNRIMAFQKMIFSETEKERKRQLHLIEPVQRNDFIQIYEAMGSLPVTIRLLDPPLAEFIPDTRSEIKALARELDIDETRIIERARELAEINPILGIRGIRLLVRYPEIAKMQVTAIIKAAIDVKKRLDIEVRPEIMLPFVGMWHEFKYAKDIIKETADKCLEEAGEKIEYLIGTMIEIPRAALLADKIAEEADFFSFGTNDLTQMTFGFSRKESENVINEYIEKGILKNNIFTSLDMRGVGRLIEMAVKGGRTSNPSLRTGVCGYQAKDEDSIDFFNRLDLGYISCEPENVPLARLAAAKAAVRNNAGAKKEMDSKPY